MRCSLNIVIAVLGLLSNLAYADNIKCYEPSPNLSALGDTYYDLEKTSILSNDEKNRINAFFSALAGKWKGDARTIECRGPDSAPLIKMRDAVLTAQAHLDSMISLSIDANKHYLEESIKKSELLSLLGNTPVFGLEFIDDNHLVFSEKYRRLNKPVQKPNPNASSSTLTTIINKITGNTKTDSATTKVPEARKLSRVTETIYNLSFENGLLMVSRSYYTNGVFTGADLWQLSRD
jgi:hypothetical protein